MIKLSRAEIPEPLRARVAERAVRLRALLQAGGDPPQALLDSYRDPELKAHLIAEARGKCIYCESNITHVYFGDIEHIKPKAKFREESLDPGNLGLACAICNNAKGNFWDDDTPLLNPYVDQPSEEMLALGFWISRRPGRNRPRITIEQLQLNRQALLERRKERIELLQPLADQYMQEPAGLVKEILKRELCRQAADAGEYAMIVRAYLQAACDVQCEAA